MVKLVLVAAILAVVLMATSAESPKKSDLKTKQLGVNLKGLKKKGVPSELLHIFRELRHEKMMRKKMGKKIKKRKEHLVHKLKQLKIDEKQYKKYLLMVKKFKKQAKRRMKEQRRDQKREFKKALKRREKMRKRHERHPGHAQEGH